MTQVGFIGWRGMVGSVLMQRMVEEDDFSRVEPVFFSTSAAGKTGPDYGGNSAELQDAYDVDALSRLPIIVTCQGSDHSKEVLPKLLEAGWDGYWIDAASAFRVDDDSVLVLDPVNRQIMDEALDNGVKKLIGSNCTVSTMLMGLSGLFASGHIEWVSSMTYQAASGVGSQAMIELIQQMHSIGESAQDLIAAPSTSILDIDKNLSAHLGSESMPIEQFGYPLAASLLPWIDSATENGMTREEWKGMVETNKILGSDSNIAIDGTCVRIGAMRSHSHGLTIKLKQDVPLDEIEDMIASAHEWVNLVPNDEESSKNHLTPAAVSGSLQIAVGRVRKMKMGPEFLNAFTVGDQLLWGAAEPLRRAMNIVIERNP